MIDLRRRSILLAGGGAVASAALAACGHSEVPGADPLGGGSVPTDPSGFKALVAIILFGGNDAFNMVVPSARDAYQVYADARLELALPRSALLSLGAADNGVPFGLHPAMGSLQSLYRAGHAAVVSNVGTLVEPIADGQVRSGAFTLPPRLMSHNDQQDQWQKTAAASLEAIGWAGRAADLLTPGLATQVLPIGISYAGSQMLQTGRQQTGFALRSSGPVEASFLRNNDAVRAQYDALLQSAAEDDHLFVQAYAKGHQRGLLYNDLIAAALEVAPDLPVAFPDDNLGRQLSAVAKMMSVRSTLQLQRQVYVVSMGGFDTHSDQLARHDSLLRSLSDNLAAFYQATEAMGIAGNVTSFTISDFGRSLTVNGDGTDHGWGSHQLVVGGQVQGQQFYGYMPDLAPGSARDYGNSGRFAPGVSVDQYGATLLEWLGVASGDLSAVFPNLDRFERRNLGFLI